MENSSIEWTDHTFNPWIGCAKVSPGCAHCYAETLMDTRYGRVKWGKGQPRSLTSRANWSKPRQWNKAAGETVARIKADIGNASEYNAVDYERPRVFCASLADWLDDEVPAEWLVNLLELIHETRHLDWLLLTKRPENFLPRMAAALKTHKAKVSMRLGCQIANWIGGHRWSNVWIGTAIEDQQRADERIPALLKIPATVRFLSCEPLLGPLDLQSQISNLKSPITEGVHWIICGGESGPGARPMQEAWVKSLRDQCQSAGCAFFFKQWGGTNKKATGRLLDGRTWDETP